MFIWIIFMINYASVIEAIVCIVYEMFYIYTPFGINMKCAYDYLQKKNPTNASQAKQRISDLEHNCRYRRDLPLWFLMSVRY